MHPYLILTEDIPISIQPNTHIHCIIYHPKLGCMEFCKHCNKMRSTFCDNPSGLTPPNISTLISNANMDSFNTQSLTKSLRRIFHFYISPYKQTNLYIDINDLNKKYNTTNEDTHIFSSLRSYMDLNKRLNLAIPQPAGPLAPHAMLIVKSTQKFTWK